MTENASDPVPTPDEKPAAKKAAAKKTTPAKKVVDANKAGDKVIVDGEKKTATEKRDPRSLYLPALPEGFEYTGITATGPSGESLVITPVADADAAPGSASLTFEGANLNRTSQYATMKDAITAAGKAAKGMAKIAQREADLAKTREEAFDL